MNCKLCGSFDENIENYDYHLPLGLCSECLKRAANSYHHARCGEWLDYPNKVAVIAYKKKTIPADLRKQVFERDEYRCIVCDGFKDLTVDHVYPEVLGGPMEMGNLVTMCKSCNSSKRDAA